MAASRGMLSRIPHKAHGVVAADRGHHASVRLNATAPQVRGPGRSRQWAGIRRVADVPQPQELSPLTLATVRPSGLYAEPVAPLLVAMPMRRGWSRSVTVSQPQAEVGGGRDDRPSGPNPAE
jgi:hypothetical protein